MLAKAALTGRDRSSIPHGMEIAGLVTSDIATEAVVHAAPDGYTLLVVSLANVFNATLYDKLNFDFIRDIAPIATFGVKFSGAPTDFD